MKPFTSNRHRAQRGMTLIETLVAIVVFTIVFLAALGLYQAANRAYMATDAATIQQQNGRFALDRVVETLRDAGANYNTTGNSNVPDEQVEGAWESAVFVRADYDNSREGGLENTTFPIVSTGNDEIVGYVLLKNGTGSLPITIKADLTPSGSPGRDAVKSGATITNEETATVNVAARTLAEQTNPPYQLARVTFSSTGAPQYQIVAENVFRLSFDYKDAAGAEAITVSSNSGSADAQRTARASVRRIGVNLITMADRPDFGYKDFRTYTTDAFGHTAPTAVASSRNRRKFDLSEEVVGVSLGRKGARHNATPKVTILAPTSLTVCTGHYLNYYLTWPATTTPGIATYRVHVQHGTSPVIHEYTNVPATEYRYAQTDTAVESYTFSVAGIAGSSAGSYTPDVPKTATHELPASTPSAPAGITTAQAATGNAMQVTWTPVTVNTGTLTASSCTSSSGGSSVPPSPWNREAVDLDHYQVYRVLYPPAATGSFTPASTNRVDAVGPLSTVVDLVNSTPRAAVFTDNTAAPCGQYFYRLQAYDGAGTVSADSTAMTSRASYIPAAGLRPATPQTPGPTPAGVTMSGGNYSFTLTWPAVVRDTAGNPAATAHYGITRQQKRTSDPATSWGTPAMTPLSVYEATSVADTVPVQVGGVNMDYRYRVTAAYDCNALGDTDRVSADSPWYVLTCPAPAGTSISIAVPTAGTVVSRPQETGFTPRLTTVGGTSWTGYDVDITAPDGTIVYTASSSLSPVSNVYDTLPAWDVSNLGTYPNGTYNMRVVGRAGSCRSTPVTRAIVLETGTCGLQIVDSSLQPQTGTPSDRQKQLAFTVQNTCDGAPITINGFTLTYSGEPSGTTIASVSYNGSTNTSGLSAVSGTAITLTTPVTIAAGATSNEFRIVYTLQFTSGATRWTSIVANTNAGTDEILTTTITP